MKMAEVWRSEGVATVGRVFVAALMVVVGVQHIIYAQFIATLVPACLPWRLFWAYFVGAAFFAAALTLLTKIQVRLAATLLGILFTIFVIIVHAPRIATHLNKSDEWVSGFVALAMAGCGFIIAGAATWPGDVIGKLGRWCFGVAISAFGVEAFIYAIFHKGIGPPWDVGNAAGGYVAGVILLSAGTWILVGKKIELPAIVLGVTICIYAAALWCRR